MRHRIVMAMCGLALLAGLAAPASASASTAPTPHLPGIAAVHAFQQRTAPECNTVKIVNPSTGTSFYLQGCGSGPNRESWIQDFAPGQTITVDGASLKPNGCGTKTSPCVTFISLSPPS